tara:strand:+ start:935 stop:1039 length:105 start_codon:yes stop_codon:yes gene_type:complete
MHGSSANSVCIGYNVNIRKEGIGPPSTTLVKEEK